MVSRFVLILWLVSGNAFGYLVLEYPTGFYALMSRKKDMTQFQPCGKLNIHTEKQNLPLAEAITECAKFVTQNPTGLAYKNPYEVPFLKYVYWVSAHFEVPTRALDEKEPFDTLVQLAHREEKSLRIDRTRDDEFEASDYLAQTILSHSELLDPLIAENESHYLAEEGESGWVNKIAISALTGTFRDQEISYQLGKKVNGADIDTACRPGWAPLSLTTYKAQGLSEGANPRFWEWAREQAEKKDGLELLLWEPVYEKKLATDGSEGFIPSAKFIQIDYAEAAWLPRYRNQKAPERRYAEKEAGNKAFQPLCIRRYFTPQTVQITEPVSSEEVTKLDAISHAEMLRKFYLTAETERHLVPVLRTEGSVDRNMLQAIRPAIERALRLDLPRYADVEKGAQVRLREKRKAEITATQKSLEEERKQISQRLDEIRQELPLLTLQVKEAQRTQTPFDVKRTDKKVMEVGKEYEEKTKRLSDINFDSIQLNLEFVKLGLEEKIANEANLKTGG